ncbi:MAG: DUF333 domain-containing protein [Chloroflexi bacterium]|nr:DUF333 domain-containing protein [Chloroflexota bacterium]
MKSSFTRLSVLILSLFLSSCSPPATETAAPAPEQTETKAPSGMANPASVYCLEQGYKSENRLDASGNAYGVCIFPNGSECDEWAFYNGQCKPAEENEAAPYIGAYVVAEYTRMRDAPESGPQTVTVRRIEEVAAMVDNRTLRIAVRYEGDSGGMLNTEPWSYLVDLENGTILEDDSKGHVLEAFGSPFNTTADALIYKVGYEEVIDGWSFQWQGFSKRDLKTRLLLQSETACEVYDPQGLHWGRYADRIEPLEIHIP